MDITHTAHGRKLAQGWLRVTRSILIGDLVAERREKRGLGFVEAEAGPRVERSEPGTQKSPAAPQIGPRHLQIFDVRRKKSRLVCRADVVVHKAGPGERVHVPKAAKLGHPKVDGVPRCEKKAESASPCYERKAKNSRRCKATTRKRGIDVDALAAAISAAQAELEEEQLFGEG